MILININRNCIIIAESPPKNHPKPRYFLQGYQEIHINKSLLKRKANILQVQRIPEDREAHQLKIIIRLKDIGSHISFKRNYLTTIVSMSKTF